MTAIRQYTAGEYAALQIRVAHTNKKRERAVRKHLEDPAATVSLELGCGHPEFAIKLARAQHNWVIGISKAELPLPQVESGVIEQGDYLANNQVLYVSANYEEVLENHDKYDWLAGRVTDTYMIMPEPFDGTLYDQEVIIWARLAAPQGRLHVRTERFGVFERVEREIPLPYTCIDFPEEALAISSYASRVAQRQGAALLHKSFQLT